MIKQCNLAHGLILIGNECYDYKTLCSSMLPNNKNYYHPDHITFCQNYTFWSTYIEHDIEGNPIRPWMSDENKTIYVCTGNYPGFGSYIPRAKHSKVYSSHSKPGCNEIAYCPDNSDIVCPADDTRCGTSDFFT